MKTKGSEDPSRQLQLVPRPQAIQTSLAVAEGSSVSDGAGPDLRLASPGAALSLLSQVIKGMLASSWPTHRIISYLLSSTEYQPLVATAAADSDSAGNGNGNVTTFLSELVDSVRAELIARSPINVGVAESSTRLAPPKFVQDLQDLTPEVDVQHRMAIAIRLAEERLATAFIYEATQPQTQTQTQSSSPPPQVAGTGLNGGAKRIRGGSVVAEMLEQYFGFLERYGRYKREELAARSSANNHNGANSDGASSDVVRSRLRSALPSLRSLMDGTLDDPSGALAMTQAPQQLHQTLINVNVNTPPRREITHEVASLDEDVEWTTTSTELSGDRPYVSIGEDGKIIISGSGAILPSGGKEWSYESDSDASGPRPSSDSSEAPELSLSPGEDSPDTLCTEPAGENNGWAEE